MERSSLLGPFPEGIKEISQFLKNLNLARKAMNEIDTIRPIILNKELNSIYSLNEKFSP